MGFDAARATRHDLSAELLLRLEMQELQDRYIATIDNDRLEEWPGLFVEDCLYEIMPRENEDAGSASPLMRCDNAAMLRDRVLSLRHANIYEQAGLPAFPLRPIVADDGRASRRRCRPATWWSTPRT